MKMPSKKPGSGKKLVAKGDSTYFEKRSKNNEAVKKSREKARQKAKETIEKVTELKQVRFLFAPFNFLKSS